MSKKDSSIYQDLMSKLDQAKTYKILVDGIVMSFEDYDLLLREMTLFGDRPYLGGATFCGLPIYRSKEIKDVSLVFKGMKNELSN